MLHTDFGPVYTTPLRCPTIRCHCCHPAAVPDHHFPTTVNSLRHPTTLTLPDYPTRQPHAPPQPPPPTSLQAETQLGDDWKLMRGGRPGVPKVI